MVSFGQVNDAKTVSIRNFNKTIMEDSRVSISMVGNRYIKFPSSFSRKHSEQHLFSFLTLNLWDIRYLLEMA